MGELQKPDCPFEMNWPLDKQIEILLTGLLSIPFNKLPVCHLLISDFDVLHGFSQAGFFNNIWHEDEMHFFKVCERMSCEKCKIIVYIWKYGH